LDRTLIEQYYINNIKEIKMAVPKFEYFPTREAFDTARGATTVFNNSVVFIEDTMELFTHGHFWTVSNLSQYYNSSTQKLQLKNGNTVISELDASPFIKDGMLESVKLITTPEGSSAVLSVNGTNYSIETIDALTLPDKQWDYADTWHDGMKVLPVLDPNKAYKIINVKRVEMQNSLDVIFQNSGSFILQFPELTMTSYDVANHVEAIYAPIVAGETGYYGDISISTEVGKTDWIRFTTTSSYHPLEPDPENEYPYTPNENITYYGYEIGSPNYSVLSSATETTGSASNSNYPTLPYLKFTFNTFNGESTHTVIRVSIAELFTVYNGDNVLLSSNYAKASTYTEPAAGDKVDIAVGKLAKGVADNAAAIATKQATITGAATSITSNNLTASKALISDANGKVAVSNVTSTELGYLSGVTSNIQTQLNAKANIADLGWVEH
jgi:hypothetical protein